MEDVAEKLAQADAYGCIFRGQRESDWKLLPGLGRTNISEDNEASMYFDFRTMAGPLLPENISPWSLAISMQHHGLPTRLLDWTESFAVALFFALREGGGRPCVWMLDPYLVNERLSQNACLYSMQDIDGDYESLFIEKTKKAQAPVIAAAPNRHHPRALSQKSLFTVHSDAQTPLNEIVPDAVKKIEIPQDAIPAAKRFLRLAGINEFTIFPDLDGLTREIRRVHFDS
ncbi:FRG domain-containing protein [Pseudomonas fragariae (ex Marin et al. 2024)]|uniref:FRG domain-containing protein n=1 Tax=Pseudomonas TaxID=286 RepID=UPI0013E8F841|nr:FRG domain-containing protein [Pseudomonas syringae]MCH5508879.1 FRG domain-containing protein [Pseudomonas syringae pv. syringae]MCH5637618.1 FRG domain-containing protein [Pseudomonas syringae pv. syringae]MCH7426751.1 FRG domain-containing protein [Pseudomonas syringae pv. syringae]